MRESCLHHEGSGNSKIRWENQRSAVIELSLLRITDDLLNVVSLQLWDNSNPRRLMARYVYHNSVLSKKPSVLEVEDEAIDMMDEVVVGMVVKKHDVDQTVALVVAANA